MNSLVIWIAGFLTFVVAMLGFVLPVIYNMNTDLVYIIFPLAITSFILVMILFANKISPKIQTLIEQKENS